jgi:hypothetical protein
MHKLRVVSIGSSLVALLATPLARAEEGEFQLGLATPFLVHQSLTGDTEPEETKRSDTTWGIGHDVVAELGYGITPNLVVGGLVELGGDSTTVEFGDVEAESSTFSLLLGPKLDYVFSPGDKVQPFVGGVIGYFNTSATDDGDPDETTTFSGFQFMARGGLRIFRAKSSASTPGLG